eukprot:15349247-Ditylum_brightwellii.AAC.1
MRHSGSTTKTPKVSPAWRKCVIHALDERVQDGDNPADERHQGGTCTGLVNNMVGRHIMLGENKLGLGQWSYVKIAGRDQHKIVFVTAYKPCVQSNPGDNIVTAQQKCLLTTQGA